jgi:hypothetical protein
MERSNLQFIVLTVGTIVFAIILYLLVQVDKGKIPFTLTQDSAEFNQLTKNISTVYSKPDNNSTVITTISADTKVKTTSETKFYFKIEKIEGQNNFTDGYISKRQLKHLK